MTSNHGREIGRVNPTWPWTSSIKDSFDKGISHLFPTTPSLYISQAPMYFHDFLNSLPMFFVWISHDFPMIFPRCSMMFPWFPTDSPMNFLWFPMFSFDFPMISHGFQVCHQPLWPQRGHRRAGHGAHEDPTSSGSTWLAAASSEPPGGWGHGWGGETHHLDWWV